jgi:tetratricopeptide (TPR) repeat protein
MRALFLASTGRVRRSVSLLRECVELDPLDYLSYSSLGAALIFNGELDEADAVATDTLKRWPEFTNSAAAAAQTAAWKGDFERARRIVAEHELGVYRRSVTWFIEVYSTDTPEAQRRPIAALRAQHRDTGWAGFDTVMFAAHLGYADEALEIALAAGLEPATQDDSRNAEVYYLPTLFMVSMPEARRNPRFVKLCAKLGLVSYWLESDSWPDCVDEVAPHYDFKAECRRVAAAAPQSP